MLHQTINQSWRICRPCLASDRNMKRCLATPFWAQPREPGTQEKRFTLRDLADQKTNSLYLEKKNIYIYTRPPPQDLRFRGSWGMGRTKHCNAQKNPKFPTLKLTKHCNAQKIPKIPKILASMARPEANSLKVWNFLSITVFREL